MNVLGVDTATPSTVAAVLRADGEIFESRHDPEPGTRPNHSALLAHVERALAAAGLTLDDVDRVAAGVGPGGFTGLRIGISTARALAQGRGLPLVAVSSLEALAQTTGAVPVIDARRKEVFSVVDGVPGAYDPADLAARLPAGSLVAGDGALAYAEVLTAAGHRPAETHHLGGRALCALGRDGTPVEPRDVLPDYRRDPDAVPPSGR